MVNHLMTCEEHRGAHHFAVVNEGRGLHMSVHAVQCLKDAKLLPADFEVVDNREDY